LSRQVVDEGLDIQEDYRFTNINIRFDLKPLIGQKCSEWAMSKKVTSSSRLASPSNINRA